MARPVDPRLWRHARSARRYLIISVGLSLVITAGIVVAALMLARIAAGVITDPGQRTIGAWTTELAILAAAIAVRTVASWWQSRLAHRAGAQVVAELENSVLAAGAALPPRELDRRRTELAVVVGDGLGGLRAYLTGYLPALLLAVLVPPVVLAVIAVHDLTAAIIILVTLPLIPIFMILIGLMTQGRAADALAATTRLSDQMLDLFAGMPTLRALGRETGAAEDGAPTMRHRVRELGEALHKRTMATLRMAFLSSMVLEMLATLCVALVAVSIGMRLVFGHMGLYAGLLGLILAPEVYLPLRAVGERFHAAQDGMAAAERAFAILEPDRTERDLSAGVTGAREVSVEADAPTEPRRADARSVRRSGEPRAARVPVTVEPGTGDIELRDVWVRARDGYAPAGLSGVLRPGAVTALIGPNGSGKSTALLVILGLMAPERGAVLAGGRPAGELDPDGWWSHIAWLPQRPVLLPGTLRENLELFGAQAGDGGRGGTTGRAEAVDNACAATGFDTVLDELPDGWDTVVGPGGVGLSLGQRQRLALVRVLAADRPILLFDEPTAHLDEHSEATVLAALTERARAGATVVVVAHRPTVLAIADHIIEVHARADSDPAEDHAAQRESAGPESDGSEHAAPAEVEGANEVRRGDARAAGTSVAPIGVGRAMTRGWTP
ncbi:MULTISPECIES: thiol reductant ABC exporter subunit CydD [Nocardia]|jgi:ATP-binding cassette subfamily C protein CydD|uniref:thiol reductant ABC exporter subunit CydD n=1 Tax=Nocardia TaxID=1817 RepID=UPI0009ED2E98|nr:MULTISPECIES: thiol reductant ABC exporter subunit CydD [Nocardia]PPI95221.1 thiol reductant ABC exporter subunit CydD [Nocardia nova]PPJ11244.1 thiol reductant ABC exporter subunit CydD [Nocardia nova]